MATKREIQIVIDPTAAEQGAARIAAAEKVVADQTNALEAALKALDAAQRSVRDSSVSSSVAKRAAAAATREETAATTALVVSGTAGVRTTRESVGWTQKQALVTLEAAAATRNYDQAVRGATVGTFSLQRAFGSFLTGLSAAAVLRGVTNELAGLETVQAKLRAVSDERDTPQFARLGEQARKFGETSIFTARTVTEAQLELAKANFSVADSLKIAPNVLNLATAETIALGDAAKITSETLSKFKLDASQAERVVDSLSVAANKSTTSVPALAEALKESGPLAKQLNVPLEETVGLLASISDVAQGSEAGTGLKGVIASLIDPTTEGKAVLKELGLEVADVNPKIVGLTNVLEELKKRGLSEPQVFQLFRREAASVAIALTENTRTARELTEAQRALSGQTALTAAAIADTLGGSLLRFKAQLSSIVDSAGEEGLSGTLRGVVDVTTDVLKVMNGGTVQGSAYNATLQALVNTATLLIGLRVAIAITSWASSMRAAAAAGTSLNATLLANPYVLATAAVVGLTTALVSLADSYNGATEAKEKNDAALARRAAGDSGIGLGVVLSGLRGTGAIDANRPQGLSPESRIAFDAIEKNLFDLGKAPVEDTASGLFKIPNLNDEQFRAIKTQVRDLYDALKVDTAAGAKEVAETIRTQFLAAIQSSGLRADLKNEFDLAFKGIDDVARSKKVSVVVDDQAFDRAGELLESLRRETELVGKSAEEKRAAEIITRGAALAEEAFGKNTNASWNYLVDLVTAVEQYVDRMKKHTAETKAAAEAEKALNEAKASREDLAQITRELELEESLIGATNDEKAIAADVSRVAAIAEKAYGDSVGEAAAFVKDYELRLKALAKTHADAAQAIKTADINATINDLTFERSTAGLDDEERRIRSQVRAFNTRALEAFGDDANAAADATKRFETELRALAETEKEWDRITRIAEGTANSLGGALNGLGSDLLDGADAFMSIADAAKAFGKEIALGVFNELATKPLVESTAKGLKGILGEATGLDDPAKVGSTIQAQSVAIQATSVVVSGGAGGSIPAGVVSGGSGGGGGPGGGFSSFSSASSNVGTSPSPFGPPGLVNGTDYFGQTEAQAAGNPSMLTSASNLGAGMISSPLGFGLTALGGAGALAGGVSAMSSKESTGGKVAGGAAALGGALMLAGLIPGLQFLIPIGLALSLGGGIGGSFFSAKGNVFRGNNVVPFAMGGTTSGETYFPLSGSRIGVAGEAGEEAIIPLQRGRNGKLGVAGGGGSVTVNQYITTPDAPSFRRSATHTAARAAADARQIRGRN